MLSATSKFSFVNGTIWTEAGKTFMIGLFKERHLGDRKADIDAIAKQIGARFYRLWGHHKWGNLEEVKLVFYK